MKGLTARVATVSKEAMYCGAPKATNKKGNNFAKKNEATAPEVIVCYDSVGNSGGGEGRTVVNLFCKSAG